MTFTIDSGLAALVGALIGSLPPIIVIVVQRKTEFKKKLMEIAYEMAKDNQRSDIEMTNKRKRISTTLYPIDVYYIYHYRFLMTLYKNETITDEQLIKLRQEQEKFEETYESDSVGY
jgi:hypothetical protein